MRQARAFSRVASILDFYYKVQNRVLLNFVTSFLLFFTSFKGGFIKWITTIFVIYQEKYLCHVLSSSVGWKRHFIQTASPIFTPIRVVFFGKNVSVCLSLVLSVVLMPIFGFIETSCKIHPLNLITSFHRFSKKNAVIFEKPKNTIFLILGYNYFIEFQIKKSAR